MDGGRVHIYHGIRKELGCDPKRVAGFLEQYDVAEQFNHRKNSIFGKVQEAFPLARFTVDSRVNWEQRYYEIYLVFEKGEGYGAGVQAGEVDGGPLLFETNQGGANGSEISPDPGEGPGVHKA